MGAKCASSAQKTLRVRKEMRPWKGKEGGNKQEKRGQTGRERAKKTSCSLGDRPHEVHYSREGESNARSSWESERLIT